MGSGFPEKRRTEAFQYHVTNVMYRHSGILNKKKCDFVYCSPQALRNSIDGVF